jgi:hypothetical protein
VSSKASHAPEELPGMCFHPTGQSRSPPQRTAIAAGVGSRLLEHQAPEIQYMQGVSKLHFLATWVGYTPCFIPEKLFCIRQA